MPILVTLIGGLIVAWAVEKYLFGRDLTLFSALTWGGTLVLISVMAQLRKNKSKA